MVNRSFSLASPCVLILFILHLFQSIHCETPSAPAVFVFGDSLFDNGNNNKLNTLARANYRPYGAEFADGATGRFTNNETLVDIIAQLLGLPMPPAYQRLDLGSFKNLTGVNYASGGAGILPETGKFFGGAITLGKQIDSFQNTIEKVLQPQLGSPEKLEKYLAKSIFLVCIGTNDYVLNYVEPIFSNASKQYTPQAYAPFLLGKLSEHLQRLYKLGARKIVKFEIGPIGCMPSTLQRFEPETPCENYYNELVSYFNTQLGAKLQQLTSDLPGSIFIHGKVYDYFNRFVQNPAEYGFTEIKKTCCVATLSKTCFPLLKPCKNSREHLWWDGYHPTSAAYSIVARDCYNGSSACFPININQLAQA